ncbi:MAG: ARPP-1 family domain-containing protein [Promethearchaeota archaeon]
MKNVSTQIVEMLFENPSEILEFEKPQYHGNMAIIPIIYKGKTLEFISVKKAEELDLISINETDTVSQLEVINNSDKQVLIPFGVTVHGGKQDRTIWEPILLAAGGKQNISGTNKGPMEQKYTIPAKCVEQSRWNYRKEKGFKSSSTRLHPNVAFAAISSVGQGSVWNEIQAYRSEMKYNANIAPTQSYLEMTDNIEKETEKIVNSFNNLEDQCGIATYINNEFIGIEFYANTQVWEEMSKDILKAFAIESLRFKDKPLKDKSTLTKGHLTTTLQSLKLIFTSRKGIGLGEVVEFESEDKKWRGNTLIQENSCVQFYIVSKRGGSTQTNEREQFFQTNISQRYI